MNYVIGIDLGTSGVTSILANELGEIVRSTSKTYPLFKEEVGYSEQNPEDWVEQTISGLKELVTGFAGRDSIKGISFSGQMHSLVLLDEKNKVLRNAILWNDTRTTEQCKTIYDIVGKERLLRITKNPALEGFTLPKLLWVKQYEPDVYERVQTMLLPKDYVRYRLTGSLHMDYSDAAGTLLLDVSKKVWSKEICSLLHINETILPPLVASSDKVGSLRKDIAQELGLQHEIAVFAGGADNACGAIGAGILEDGKTLCSIGTSGVVLTYEGESDENFGGKVHYFNHGAPDAFYAMGVTLAAGHSLNWFKDIIAPNESFDDLIAEIDTVPVGANGLLFTPYIVGERTPHADATIRGSFIGMDSAHERRHFVRAVMEGITFSLAESIEIFRDNGKNIDTIVSIGGGAKNERWLQMQADIFDTQVIRLKTEQGPAMGAVMLAAFGSGIFSSLQQCAEQFLQIEATYKPNSDNVEIYRALFDTYKDVYRYTKQLNEQLISFRP